MRRSVWHMLAAAVIVLLACVCGADEKQGAQAEQDFQAQRESMVRWQIQSRGIRDKRVLGAMLKVRRHLFVPEPYREWAYIDGPLPIGERQTISQPYIVALMTELLELSPNDKVLEIGTGSGYQAAILAELSDSVYTIEILRPLADRAQQILDSLGYEWVNIRHGDGYAGWPEEAPFDAIIVTAAPPEVPPALVEQLDEGGRMVIPVGTDWQELLLIQKVDSQIVERSVAPVRFVPMIHDDDD